MSGKGGESVELHQAVGVAVGVAVVDGSAIRL